MAGLPGEVIDQSDKNTTIYVFGSGRCTRGDDVRELESREKWDENWVYIWSGAGFCLLRLSYDRIFFYQCGLVCSRSCWS